MGPDGFLSSKFALFLSQIYDSLGIFSNNKFQTSLEPIRKKRGREDNGKFNHFKFLNNKLLKIVRIQIFYASIIIIISDYYIY